MGASALQGAAAGGDAVGPGALGAYGRPVSGALRGVVGRPGPDRGGLCERHGYARAPGGAAAHGCGFRATAGGDGHAPGGCGGLAGQPGWRGTPAGGPEGGRGTGCAVCGGGAGAGVGRGVPEGTVRLQGLRDRERPEASAGRADDGARGGPGVRVPVLREGRGLAPDLVAAGELPGFQREELGGLSAAGGDCGAALRGGPGRAGGPSPLHPSVLPGPGRRKADAGGPGVLGGGGGAVPRYPDVEVRRGVHRRHDGGRQVDDACGEPEPPDARARLQAEPGHAGGPGRVRDTGCDADRARDAGRGRGARPGLRGGD